MKYRFSYSQLSTFEQCELSWKLSRLDKLDQRTAGWFHQGTAAHTAIEEWLTDNSRDISNEFEWAYDTLIDEYSISHELDHLWMRGRGTVMNDLLNRRAAGAAQIKHFREWWKGAGFKVDIINGSPALETKVSYESDRWFLVGYVDALLTDQGGNHWVIDFKTGKSRSHNDGRQLALYKMILEKDNPDITYNMAYIYLNADGFPDFVPMSPEGFDEEHFIEAFDAMAEAIDEKKITGNWVASPPKPCFTCTVAHHCEEKE
jgi:RecB family exonuclease